MGGSLIKINQESKCVLLPTQTLDPNQLLLVGQKPDLRRVWAKKILQLIPIGYGSTSVHGTSFSDGGGESTVLVLPKNDQLGAKGHPLRMVLDPSGHCRDMREALNSLQPKRRLMAAI